MPVYSDNNILTFNGPASVADQFSQPVNLTGVNTLREVAFFFTMNVTNAGVWAVTLQFYPDPASVTPLFGWRDEARSNITVLNTLTSANLAQTNAAISGGITRGGVVTATGDYSLLLRFQPAPFSYRLRFQLTSAFTATIPKITFSSGV